MFYTHKVVFVHVPRTGGTWLTNWARDHLEASIDCHHLKHASLQEIHRAIPGTIGLEPFCIDRPRDDRLRSYYDLLQIADPWTENWNNIIKAVRQMSYEQFLESRYVPMDTPDDVHLKFPYEKPLQNVLEWLKLVHEKSPQQTPGAKNFNSPSRH